MILVNRTHIAVWILIALTVTVSFSAQVVSSTCAMITDELYQIEKYTLDGNQSAAHQLSQELAWKAQHNACLRLFVRRDLLIELCTGLSGITAYTDIEHYADLRNETEKARNQVRALKESFFGFV